MKFIKDKKVISLIAILLVFTIGYFIVITNISHAFLDKNSSIELYQNLIETIKKCSIAYTKKNQNLFKEDKVVYIKVQDLIDNDLIVTNSDGNIINPITQDSLNNNIIKLKIENEEVLVSVDS